MAPIYHNPPLVEAICELHFVASQPWDWTVPGLLYHRLRDEFPLKDQQNFLELEWGMEQEGTKRRVKGGMARMRFWSADRSAVVQTAPDMLAISQLLPYPGWRSVKAMILRAMGHYREVSAPSGISAANLRYLNRIYAPGPRATIEDYLLAAPHVPDTMPQEMAPFLTEAVLPYRQLEAEMRLRTGTLPTDDDRIALSLDIQMWSTPETHLQFETLGDWLHAAHGAIEEAFEACIGPRARESFAQEDGRNG